MTFVANTYYTKTIIEITDFVNFRVEYDFRKHDEYIKVIIYNEDDVVHEAWLLKSEWIPTTDVIITSFSYYIKINDKLIKLEIQLFDISTDIKSPSINDRLGNRIFFKVFIDSKPILYSGSLVLYYTHGDISQPPGLCTAIRKLEYLEYKLDQLIERFNKFETTFDDILNHPVFGIEAKKQEDEFTSIMKDLGLNS